MPNFTVENRLGTAPDIQRNFLFEFTATGLGVLLKNAANSNPGAKFSAITETVEDDIIIRSKTCSIPARGNDVIESYFMGMKQLFPGRATFENTLSVNIDETEDQLVLQTLYLWRQMVLNISDKSTNAGYSQVGDKRSLTSDLRLQTYKFDGTKMENSIIFKNAWPSNVDGVELNMTGNEKVMYNATFTYDYWFLKDATVG